MAIIYSHGEERRLWIEGIIQITKDKGGDCQCWAESWPKALRRPFYPASQTESCSSLSPSWEKPLRWLWELEAEFNRLTYISKPKELYWAALNICRWRTANQRTVVCLYILLPQARCAKRLKKEFVLSRVCPPFLRHVHTGHVGTMCTCPYTNTAWYKSIPTASSSKYLQLHSLLTSFLWTITMEIP